jgi:glycosidase
MVSKVDSRPGIQKCSAKLWESYSLLLKGTPFLYQGQEFGSVNAEFQSIEENTGCRSINLYNELLKNMDKEKAFKKLLQGQEIMQGSQLTGKEQKTPKYSLFFRINFIEKTGKALIYGDFETVLEKKKDLFLYYRKGDNVFFVNVI